MTLLELANRAAAATGPDRELDRDIMEALRLPPDYTADWGPRDSCQPAPFAYTSSLDAAMTLVPEGECEWTFLQSLLTGGWQAMVGLEGKEVIAATAPLALTAACLRARHDCR